MPFYEYRCKKCGQRFELQQKMEERGRASCPGCGSAEAEKLFSVFGVGVAGSSAKDESPGCGPENCRCGRFGGDD